MPDIRDGGFKRCNRRASSVPARPSYAAHSEFAPFSRLHVGAQSGTMMRCYELISCVRRRRVSGERMIWGARQDQTSQRNRRVLVRMLVQVVRRTDEALFANQEEIR